MARRGAERWSSSPTPRVPSEAVEQQLGRIGLPRDAWDGIATSGEAGIAALKALGRPVGFLGTREDRAILESRGIEIADGGNFTDLACTGLDEAAAERRGLCRRARRLGGGERL